MLLCDYFFYPDNQNAYKYAQVKFPALATPT